MPRYRDILRSDERVEDPNLTGKKAAAEAAAAWAPTVCGIALVMAAGLHRLQLGSPSYTTSLLIPLEFFLLLAVGLGILMQPVMAVVCCWKRDWRALGITAINTAISIGSIAGALSLDAATLLYMT